MLVDLACPAEIFRVALPTAEIPASSLLLFNLSDRVVTSAEVTLRLMTEEGEERERLVYRARALNGRPHSTFPMNVPCTPDASIRKAEATIEKVWFADNSVWRRESGKAVDFTPNNLPVSPALTALKYVAGEPAVGYPSQQNGLWVCVCGRPNPDATRYCVRCNRQKESVFTRYNQEAVEKQMAQKERQLELQSRSALEESIRMQRIREEDYHTAQKRKSRQIRLAVGALCAAVLVAGTVAGLVPAVRMNAATRGMEEGALEAAETVLTELGSFPGARERLAECQYRIAARNAEGSGDPDTLLAAAERLRQTSDRDDAGDLADLADFRRARALMDEGDYTGARQAAERLPSDYPGLEDLLREADWTEAKENMDQRYYVLARNLFLTLGTYRDADVLADECIYRPALTMMENEEYDAAIHQLERIPEYQDSAELLLKCCYLKAEALLRIGEPGEAVKAFQAAGAYEDAAERADSLIWDLAEQAFAGADFETAMTYYKMLPDREEALLKYRAAAYTLARRALNDLENRRALELLELLPQGYEDTDRMREKAMLALGIPVTEPPASEPEPTEEPAESPAPATETPAVSSGPEETPAASPSPTPSPSATPDPTPAPTPEAAENSPETAKPAASATPADTGEDSFLVRDDED